MIKKCFPCEQKESITTMKVYHVSSNHVKVKFPQEVAYQGLSFIGKKLNSYFLQSQMDTPRVRDMHSKGQR